LGESGTAEPADVQVFNGDGVVAPDELQRGLEVEVASRAADSAVLGRQDARGLPPTRTAALATRYAPIGTAQARLGRAEVARVLDRLPVRRGEEGREPEVHAHRRAGVGQRTGRYALAREGDEPVTAPVALERDGLHAALD